VNETTAADAQSAAEALATRQLEHVGAAYLLIFVLVFVFAWRVSASTKRLTERVDELERSSR
jgi:hypothetical protein